MIHPVVRLRFVAPVPLTVFTRSPPTDSVPACLAFLLLPTFYRSWFLQRACWDPLSAPLHPFLFCCRSRHACNLPLQRTVPATTFTVSVPSLSFYAYAFWLTLWILTPRAFVPLWRAPLSCRYVTTTTARLYYLPLSLPRSHYHGSHRFHLIVPALPSVPTFPPRYTFIPTLPHNARVCYVLTAFWFFFLCLCVARNASLPLVWFHASVLRCVYAFLILTVDMYAFCTPRLYSPFFL